MSELEKTKESIKNSLKKFTGAKVLTKVIYGIIVVIILSVTFQAGMFVGFHKAQFNGAWGEHYERNFGPRPIGPMGNMMGNFPDRFPGGHGTVGKIIKLEIPNIIVVDKDNTEKIIVTNDDTDIVQFGEKVKVADLKIDDQIVVIGSPNSNGQIDAKFIRILPNGFESQKAVNLKK